MIQRVGYLRVKDGRGEDPHVELWHPKCMGDVCVITGNFRNDDSLSMVAMSVDFVLDRKKKVMNEMAFRLPPEMRGRTLVVRFAESIRKGYHLLVRTSGQLTRHISLTDCDSMECRASLPRRLLAARQSRPAMSLGQAMRAYNLVTIEYPSGPDIYETHFPLLDLRRQEWRLESAAISP